MKTIANLLVEHDIVRVEFENLFTWASGIKSPIYCDCRELMSIPEARQAVIDGFLELIKSEELATDAIAGTATAGIPWAAFVAQELNASMLYVRPEPKGHGAGKQVEGRGTTGSHILVVEDAVSTGGSSVKSADALRRELDATVTDILGIFSWSTPAVAEHEKNSGVKFRTLTHFDEIATALLESGKITEQQKDSLERFHANPREFSA